MLFWDTEPIPREILELLDTAVVANSRSVEPWDAEPIPPEMVDVMDVAAFVGSRSTGCKLMSLTVQNLSAHAPYIVADHILTNMDILAFCETCDHHESTGLAGFVCVSRSTRAEVTIAGVAIYHNTTASSEAVPHHIHQVCINRDMQLGVADQYGDICAAEISQASNRTLLFCVYCPLETTLKQKKVFMVRNLFSYYDSDMDIIVTGNFNIISKVETRDFIDFMLKYLRLNLASDVTKPTTNGGLCVDLTFSRNVSLESMRYYSDIFHHRPMLSVFE